MIVALAGGIGAAKLVLGLSRLLTPRELMIIGNTGDDLQLFGLRICPDLDTLMYTLAGRVNPDTGWGIQGDRFECLSALNLLGGESWFQLGDRDLATHIWRTWLLEQGYSLTQVMAQMSGAFGVLYQILPMAEVYMPTYIGSEQGILHVQEYFVREQCRPVVRAVEYRNAEQAAPGPEIRRAIAEASMVLLCPSNPFISIGPILAVPGLRELLASTPAPVVAVTPIVQGRALKGPAARMLRELGYAVSPAAVVDLYKDFLDVFVLDERDRDLKAEIEAKGVEVFVTDTLMESEEDKVRLAEQLLKMK